ncbi:MAG: complex I subunit 5 family protein [Bdellovibrionota bacterium]
MISQLPILILICPFIAALLIGVIGSFKKSLCYPLAVLSILCSIYFSLLGVKETFLNGSRSYNLGGWGQSIGIAFYLNTYNAILLSIISFVLLATVLYSRKFIYLRFPDKFYAFYSLLLLFLTGILGIVITGDAFNLYVFLEIVSLSSYAMIALGRKESYVASFRYLIIGTIGASFYLLGVGILYLKTGNLNMQELHHYVLPLYKTTSIKASFLFIVIGLSIKIAFFPFHSWLPFAYSKTISPVSTLMAPIVTKVSLFACIKVIVLVFGVDYLFSLEGFKYLMPNIAAIGMIYFSIKAFTQKNIRASFCYVLLMECSLMFGALWFQDVLGIKAVLYHILIDILMMLTLFLSAGVLEYYYKIYNHSDLLDTNILAKEKILLFSFIITALSVLGIPPTGGFFSKFYFILVAFKANSYFYVISLIVSSFILLAFFLKFFEKIYFNYKKVPNAKNSKFPIITNAVLLVSSLLIIYFGAKVHLFIDVIINSFLG